MTVHRVQRLARLRPWQFQLAWARRLARELAREPEPAHVAAPADLEGLPAPEAPTAKQQVAIVLARQREPLLAREVQELIEGYLPVLPGRDRADDCRGTQRAQCRSRICRS